MPDLSDLLGDVYGSSDDEEPTPAPAAPNAAPAWADDEHLDRAFAEWTPGPDADAPAAERSMFTPAPRLADDLAAALSEAVLAESADEPTRPEPEPEPEPVAVREVPETMPVAVVEAEPEPEVAPEPAPIPMPVHKAGWQRSDDDILPTGKAARGPVLRMPSVPKLSRAGKAPKASKPDSGPKKPRRSFGDLMKMEIGGKKK